MTRIEFLEPTGDLTVGTVVDTLSMAPHLPQATAGQLAELSRVELLVIYDYAIREILVASDSVAVRRRSMPAVLRWASALATPDAEDDRWEWFRGLTPEQQRHAYISDQAIIGQQAKEVAALRARLQSLGGVE